MATFVLLFLLESTGECQTARPQRRGPSPQRNNVRMSEPVWRAVFLYIMEGSDKDDGLIRADRRKRLKVVFLSLADANPTKGFLSRLGYDALPVKAASKMKVDQHGKDLGSYNIVDKNDHRQGVAVSLSKLEIINPNTVRVRGGIAIGGRNGYSALYTLRYLAGKWKVVKSEKLGRA